jgi:hypothetical protein
MDILKDFEKLIAMFKKLTVATTSVACISGSLCLQTQINNVFHPYVPKKLTLMTVCMSKKEKLLYRRRCDALASFVTS